MVSFLIIGDMGSGYKMQYVIAKSMIRLIKNKKCKFICGLGDNIYEEGCNGVKDKQFITKFEKPYENINLKFYMCLGNHDYGKCLEDYNNTSEYTPTGNSKCQIEYTKFSDKWYMPHNYYMFSKGNIDFFVIDTNLERMTKSEINTQMKIMKKMMDSSNKKWKILCGHNPLRSVGGHGNPDNQIESFIKELIIYGKIDIYMAGHDHSKQLIKMDLNDKPVYLVVCGTGGKEGDPEFIYKNMIDCKLLFYTRTTGVATMSSNNKSINIKFHNKNDEIEFNYKINKILCII